MKTQRFIQLGLIFSLIFLFSCGGGYNTEFTPPDDDAGLDDVFPTTINNLKRETKIMEISDEDFKGIKAIYGEDAIFIEVIRTGEGANPQTYIDEFLNPEIDKLPSHSRGSINGKWTGKGSDDKYKYYAWVNGIWLFKIQAKIDVFDAVINEFQFISEE